MKILFVNMFYYPNMVGGTENSLKLLAEGLSVDNDVIVYTIDSESERDNLITNNPEVINNVKVYRGYNKWVIQKVIHGMTSGLHTIAINGTSIFNSKIKTDLKEIIQTEKPDVIHTNNLKGMSAWVWKYAYKKCIPVVHTLRDYWLLDPTTVYKKSACIISLLWKQYHRDFANKYLKYVTSPSNYTLNIFTNNNYFKCAESICIPNAIQFDKDILKNVVGIKKNKKEDSVNFLYVGSLTKEKGIYELMSAFMKVDNEHIVLHICGDGQLKSYVESCATKDKRIIVHGKLGVEEIKEIYKYGDVLIVPSIWDEPFGRVIIESAQYGVAAIGSDSGAIPEIINSIGNGELYHKNNVFELIKKINKFSDRSNFIEYLDNIETSIEKYSLANQLDMFKRFYRRIIQK